jgi:hypothetical protein
MVVGDMAEGLPERTAAAEFALSGWHAAFPKEVRRPAGGLEHSRRMVLGPHWRKAFDLRTPADRQAIAGR